MGTIAMSASDVAGICPRPHPNDTTGDHARREDHALDTKIRVFLSEIMGSKAQRTQQMNSGSIPGSINKRERVDSLEFE